MLQLTPQKKLQKSVVETFVDCLHPEADLAVAILAQNNLPHPVADLRISISLVPGVWALPVLWPG